MLSPGRSIGFVLRLWINYKKIGWIRELLNRIPVFFFQVSLEITQVTGNRDIFFVEGDSLYKVIAQEHHQVHGYWICSKITSIQSYYQYH